MSSSQPVMVAHPEEAYLQFARSTLEQAGFEVLTALTSEDCLAGLFTPGAADGRPLCGVVMVNMDLRAGDLQLYEELRARSQSIRILVTGENPDPERITGMLYARIDDLILGKIPRMLPERVRDALSREAGLPDCVIISASPHWVEVRLPARAVHFKWLRRFLDALEESLPGGERTKIMFALAELVRSAIEQNERRSGDANVTIACYRFQTVRIIRVRADEGVSFQLSTDASAKPFSDFGVVATRAPTQVAGNRTANNPWLEVVARFADHFLTSGAGNEVMLVRLLGDQA